ncbi:hypothetical protein FRC19_003811 [Serendipita sp. 401]|nr:hypothetical protein FRC19_003811 [Serendipita sp. 401]
MVSFTLSVVFALALGVLAVPGSFAWCGTKSLSPEGSAAIEAQIKELARAQPEALLDPPTSPSSWYRQVTPRFPDSEPISLYSTLPLDLVLFIMRPALFLLSLLLLLAALAVHGGPHLAT